MRAPAERTPHYSSSFKIEFETWCSFFFVVEHFYRTDSCLSPSSQFSNIKKPPKPKGILNATRDPRRQEERCAVLRPPGVEKLVLANARPVAMPVEGKEGPRAPAERTPHYSSSFKIGFETFKNIAILLLISHANTRSALL